MNTAEVAKLLGVSVSTVQRWVKQLALPMERNERGHYYFNDEDIQLLKDIQEQLKQGVLLQDIAPVKLEKKPRKGTKKIDLQDEAIEFLLTKIQNLEVNLQAKADGVTSYQLLQHRREIEDLQTQIDNLTSQINSLQQDINKLLTPHTDKPLVLQDGKIKRKKKKFVSSLFSFL
ncbi:MerR family transcriptional regulator [Bacillus rubiinfantis]|uniref:MerR family transcriptional regulator n=1 Tax=Bacillus rubiinfantis TaxID=1499680 RepID=UPI0005A67E19|nr:MerR family transcriptional regulator [Bacillus rubiinfantis]